jgi:hypothetical protein
VNAERGNCFPTIYQIFYRIPQAANQRPLNLICALDLQNKQANSGGGGGGTLENILSLRRPHMSRSSLPVDNLPTQMRKPYHVWIGNDDADDLVHLTPAPFRKSLEKMLMPAAFREIFDKSLNGMSSRRRCKSGWDASPQDM